MTPSSRATRWSTSGSSTTASTRSMLPRSRTRPIFVEPVSSRIPTRSVAARCRGDARPPSPSGSAIRTSRASTSSRIRLATSERSGSSSTSDARAFPISLSDSSCRSQRVEDSYRRAFSIATAACAASSWVSSSSSAVKSAPTCLLGQVEVAVGDSAEHDRDAEEGAHRRVVRREADRARILGDVVQAQRLRLADEHAEDAAPARQVADRGMGLLVDAGGEEPLEALARAIDDAERRVARFGQLGGRLGEALEQRVERELGGERDPGVDQDAQPLELVPRVGRRGLGCARLLRHSAVSSSHRADRSAEARSSRLPRPRPDTGAARTCRRESCARRASRYDA